MLIILIYGLRGGFHYHLEVITSGVVWGAQNTVQETLK